MRNPEFIKPGDTIGFAAPSFGAGDEPYITRTKAAIEQLTKRGYRIKVASSVYKNDGIGISTDPEAAAKDLMELYLDPEVKAVISAGGGELMNETMEFISPAQLKNATPKWFMGYSDNTNFLLPLTTIGEVPGIYGPCGPGFGKPWEAPEMDALALLEGEKLTVKGYDFFEDPLKEPELTEEGLPVEKDPLAKYEADAPKILTSFLPTTPEGEHRIPFDRKSEFVRKASAEEEITMEGILLGGCLDVLANLSGTKYDGVKEFCQSHEKIIWALEACELNVMSIRRTLWHLRQQGWFDTAAGFVFGRPLVGYGQEMMGLDRFNAVTGALGDLKVPMIMDADIGHVKPVVPLIFGSHGRVCAKGNDLTITMSLI